MHRTLHERTTTDCISYQSATLSISSAVTSTPSSTPNTHVLFARDGTGGGITGGAVAGTHHLSGLHYHHPVFNSDSRYHHRCPTGRGTGARHSILCPPLRPFVERSRIPDQLDQWQVLRTDHPPTYPSPLHRSFAASRTDVEPQPPSASRISGWTGWPVLRPVPCSSAGCPLRLGRREEDMTGFLRANADTKNVLYLTWVLGIRFSASSSLALA